MPETKQDIETKVRDILLDLTEDERTLLQKVIQSEKERIHMKRPHGIYDDIRESIEQVIR